MIVFSTVRRGSLHLAQANCVVRCLILIGCAICLSLAGCGGANGSHSHDNTIVGEVRVYKGDYPIQVVCTTGQIADIVRQVGGKHIKVTALMGPGVDPHLYRALPKDQVRRKTRFYFFPPRN